MHNWWRAIQYTFPYRRRLYWSLAFSLAVGVLWGANISAVYPLLNVLLEGRSLSQSAKVAEATERTEINRLKTHIAEVEGVVAELEAERKAAPDADWDSSLAERRGELSRRQSEVSSRESRLSWYAVLLPWLETYTPAEPFTCLMMVMGLMIAGVALKGFFDFLQEYLATGVVQRAVFDLRNDYFRRTVDLDLTHYSEHGTHELLARGTNDFETLTNGLKALFGKVLMEPLKVLSCLAFAWMLNWRLALLAVALFGLAPIVIGLVGRYLKRMSRRNLESMSRIYKIFQETFLSIRVVKAFSMERYERRRLFHENKRYYRQAMKLNRTEAFSGPILEFLAMLSIAMAVTCGAYMVLTGKQSILGIRLTHDPIDRSMLLTFFLFIAGMFDPLRKMISVYGRVQRGMAASDRLFQAMDRKNRVPEKRRAPSLPRHQKSIEFTDVGFRYDSSRTILQGVNIKIAFGETIAVVGPTGSGKTSLINLLPRFYDPVVGQIAIDGFDIRDGSLRSLRRQMGIVTQKTMLFDDTVFNNIAYGDRFADRGRVIEAAKAAYAHLFIEELPQGYNTIIGELGDKISGGQGQRIALARAILRDPAILILDEATSSLDVESESLILRALKKFTEGRTTFIVTHRLNVLDMADRIVVVNEGRIESVGDYKYIAHHSETFRRLLDVQARSA